MDFIFELLVSIIGEFFLGTYDLAGSAKSPKKKIWKVLSIIIISIGALFYLFMIIVIALIIFTNSTDATFKIICFFLEILFVWFVISMIKKIRKEIKTIKNKKTDIEKYMKDREKNSEDIYYIEKDEQLNTDNENCDKAVSASNEDDYDNIYSGGIYDKDRKTIILNGKEYKEK